MSETRRHHVYWAILAISFGLAGAMLGATCSGGLLGGSDASAPVSSDESPQTPDAGTTRDASPTGSARTILRPFESTASGPVVQFVDTEQNRGVFSMVLIGAPGVWPPEGRRTDDRGRLALPETNVVTIQKESLRDYELMARAPRQSLGYWGRIHFEPSSDTSGSEPRRLELQPAAPIGVEVVDPSGEPVEGADVRLSQRQIGFVHLQKAADEAGTVDFRAIPGGTYRLSASEGERRAARVFEQDVEAGRDVTLTLETRETARIPEAESDESASGTFVPVTMTLKGLSGEQWRKASFAWRRASGGWRNMVLDRGNASEQRRWTKELQSGTYELKVALGDVQDTRTLKVGDEETNETWSIEPRRMYRLFAVDAYGTPVPGALVQVWRGDRRIASKTTSGDRPIEVELTHGSSYRVVGFDSRKGEGERALKTDEFDPTRPVVVRLDQPLFSASRPPDRVTERNQLESILGAPLVEDAGAWVLDARQPDSPARRAGLQRGDRLVSVHGRNDGYRVVVERDDRIRIATLPE
jgi:hypothetical protein